MFFLTMVGRSFTRQFRRRLLIAVTVFLSSTVSVAMLGVVFDVGDKLNAELLSYGSNIVVQPKAEALVADLYSTEESAVDDAEDSSAFIEEADAPNVKKIFWAFNITDFAPQLSIHANVGDVVVPLIGTWFQKSLELESGESTLVGAQSMRNWWKVTGEWAKDDTDQAMVGINLANELGIAVGQDMTLTHGDTTQTVQVVGTYDSGDSDNDAVYVPSKTAQSLANLPGKINKIDVKALTTPENDLARKASRNPAILTQDEWEVWYCTAYPSSIAYQIEEAIPGSVAKQVRQVAAVQSNVLQKTQAVMILMTVMSLIAAAVAVANLMAASINERSSELALMKAIGATDGSVSRLMLMETAVMSVIGAAVGMAAGSGIAQIVGFVVFGSGILMRPMVFVLVAVLLTITILIASTSSIRSILGLRPAEVLHGR